MSPRLSIVTPASDKRTADLSRAEQMTASAASMAAQVAYEAVQAWNDVIAITEALAASPALPSGIREQARTLALKTRPEVDVLASIVARA